MTVVKTRAMSILICLCAGLAAIALGPSQTPPEVRAEEKKERLGSMQSNNFHNFHWDAHTADGLPAVVVRLNYDGKPTPSDPVVSRPDHQQNWVVAVHRAVILALHEWDPTLSLANPTSRPMRAKRP